MLATARRINNDSDYVFNSVRQRYVERGNGRVLPLSKERRQYELIRRDMRRELGALTRQLQGGRLSADEWQRRSLAVLRQGHYESAGFAVGGEARIPDSARREIEGLLAEEGEYLAGLADDLAADRIVMAVALRVARYALATSLSISVAVHEAHKAAGFTQAKRDLEPRARHCKHCPDLATSGWIGIDKVVPRGWQCDCRNACRCTVRYRK